MLTAKKVAQLEEANSELDQKVAALNTQLSEAKSSNKEMVEALKASSDEVSSVQQRLASVLEDNKLLLIDRTMRIRLPRCKVLAQKLLDIGEVDDAEACVEQLLPMESEKFLAVEARVNKVWEKFGHPVCCVTGHDNGFGVDTDLSHLPQ